MLDCTQQKLHGQIYSATYKLKSVPVPKTISTDATNTSLTADLRASTINHFVPGVQEVVFCLAGGFGCYAKMGENMIRGGGDKMEEREKVGGGM